MPSSIQCENPLVRTKAQYERSYIHTVVPGTAGDDCPICFNEYGSRAYEDETPEHAVRIDPCRHNFGALCLARHLEINPIEAKCPSCRVELYGIPMKEQRAERERHSSQRRQTERLVRAIEQAVVDSANGTFDPVEVGDCTRRLFEQNPERVEEVLQSEGLSDSAARKRVRKWIRKIQEMVTNAARSKRTGDVPIAVLTSVSVTDLTTAILPSEAA